MRRSAAGFAIAVLALSMITSACNVQSLLGPDDKAIVSDIQAKLFQDSVLKTRDIRVSSSRGVVELTGTVQTDLEKAAAERLASQASGVKKVDDQLTVSTPTVAEATPPEEPPRVTEPERIERPAPARPKAKKPSHPAAKTEHYAARSSDAPAPKSEESAPEAKMKESAEAAPAPPPPPPQPVQVTIPAGTVITVRMIDEVDSSQDQAGHEFGASIAAPVVVDNQVVISEGSDARVRLVKAASAGHMTGKSEVELALASITVDGSSYDADSTTYSQAGASRGKRTAETVGGGAVLGGLIGAIAGHGKGAAIGAAIGAGAGTAVQAGTKAAPIKVPAETKIDFTLKTAITLTLPPR